MSNQVRESVHLYDQIKAVVANTLTSEQPPMLGRHVLGEFFDCDSLPTKADELRQQLEEAARLIKTTVVQSVFHEFSPWGLSGVVVIAESHLAIHTWPESRAACVDLFTCNTEIDPLPGFELLAKAFGAGRTHFVDIPRGIGC